MELILDLDDVAWRKFQTVQLLGPVASVIQGPPISFGDLNIKQILPSPEYLKEAAMSKVASLLSEVVRRL